MEIDTLVYVHNCSVCWKGCVSSEARVICAHTQPWQGKGGLPTKLLIVIMIQTRSSTKGEFPNRSAECGDFPECDAKGPNIRVGGKLTVDNGLNSHPFPGKTALAALDVDLVRPDVA